MARPPERDRAGIVAIERTDTHCMYENSEGDGSRKLFLNPAPLKIDNPIMQRSANNINWLSVEIQIDIFLPICVFMGLYGSLLVGVGHSWSHTKTSKSKPQILFTQPVGNEVETNLKNGTLIGGRSTCPPIL